VTVCVIVQNDSLRYLTAFRTWFFRKIDVESLYPGNITPATKDANTVIPAPAFARVNCSGNPGQDWMPPDRVRGRLIKSGMTTIDMFTCRSKKISRRMG